MAELKAELLTERAILEFSGPDCRSFLQNLISNDIGRITPQQSIWSALLTPQGKFLHEFFIAQDTITGAEEGLLLDCASEGRDDLVKRLRLYRLRAKVGIAARDDLGGYALPGLAALERLQLNSVPGQTRALRQGVVFTDPRLASLGARAILPRDEAAAFLGNKGFELVPDAGFLALRLSLAVPEGRQELQVDKDVLLDAGFDELNGIDWRKGCFIGQEVTARMKYRALVKKRLMPVKLSGDTAKEGDVILDSEGREAGSLRKIAGDRGLALLRLSYLQAAPGSTLHAGNATVTPHLPDWFRIAQKG